MSALTKTKYEIVDINRVEVMVDVSLLPKRDEMHFNATAIAGQFNKQPSDWLRTEQAQEYIGIVSGTENIPLQNLVRTIRGGKHQGTWLHNRLALPFARWCSTEFEYLLDRWIEQRLEEEHQRKLHRRELKTGYLPLTDAIQASHDTEKDYHYSNEANLINRLITGMSAKKFKQTHNVENVRDALTPHQAKLMSKLQRQNTSLIELGFEYEQRKQLLKQQISKGSLLV